MHEKTNYKWLINRQNQHLKSLRLHLFNDILADLDSRLFITE